MRFAPAATAGCGSPGSAAETGASPLWLARPGPGPRVRRATLVLVAGSAARDRPGRRAARDAPSPSVRRVLPRLARPAGRRGAGARRPASTRALRADPGTYAGIAAVTTTVDGSPARRRAGARLRQPAGLRPAAPDGRPGRDQPRGHPRRHRRRASARCRPGCSRASPTTSRCAHVDLPLTHDRRPDHPPGPPRRAARPPARPARSSRPRARHLGARYESAWLACRLLADDAARQALVALLPAPSTPAPTSTRRCAASFGLGPGGVDRAVADPAARQAGRRERPPRAPLAALAVVAVGRGWSSVVARRSGAGARGTRCPAARRPGAGVGRCSRRRRSPAPTPTPARPATWRWASLAVSLLVACVLGLHPARRAAGRPAARAGGGCGCRWRSSRWPLIGAAGHPAASRSCCTTRVARLRAQQPGRGPAGARRPGSSQLVRRSWCTSLGLLLVLVGWPAAGRAPGRPWPACCSAALVMLGLVRLPGAGRAAVQPLHPAARRAAAHPDPAARRRGARARRRRAGRRRVPAYDDAQRLRVGLRQHAAGRALRQRCQRPAARPGRCRSSPTSSATPATTTC